MVAPLLFDLDGTLIDSIELIVNSFKHAYTGRPRVPTDADLVLGIGTPLADQFRPWCDGDAELDALVERYRDYQREHHDRLVHAYPGVAATLARLHARKHPMAVVTSKSEALAARGLAHAKLDTFFDAVVGLESCTRHKPDPEPVLTALDRLGRAPSGAFFIGDSPHDILSGNAAGVATVAALWGPFTREQLEPARPTLWLERIEDLEALL